MKEEEAYVNEPTSNACINLAFGGDLNDHGIYEYCDSDKTTCTVNVNGVTYPLTQMMQVHRPQTPVEV